MQANIILARLGLYRGPGALIRQPLEIERLIPAPLSSLAQPIDRLIARQGNEPSEGSGASGLEARRPPPHDGEDFLQNFFGFPMIPQHAVADAEEPRGGLPIELREGELILTGRACQKLLQGVRLAAGYGHLRSFRSPGAQRNSSCRFRPGTVYFAPPDYHLLIEAGRHLALSVDELVNFSRPSIDVLFESAADVYGPSLMGIILSGGSADGAAGLAAVHRAGGLTVVQEPRSAAMPLMVTSALECCPADCVLQPDQISALLRRADT